MRSLRLQPISAKWVVTLDCAGDQLALDVTGSGQLS